MVASVAANEEEYDPAKAFDLGLEPEPLAREIPVELYNLDDFSEEAENPVTPAVRAPIVPSNVIATEPSQVNNDLKKRCVIWALSDKKEIRYDTIFIIKGDWHYEVVRKQFRSMRNGKETDLAVVTAMSLVMNSESIRCFQSEIYILPPDTLSSIFRKYNDDYIDHRTRSPHSITSLVTDDHLNLVDKAKRITHRYVIFKNLFDCGTFVMKWIEVIEPAQTDPTKPYPIDAWSMEDLQKFRKEMIWQIILSKENLYVLKAIDGPISTTIHRPSAAL
ncbi:hypothetical protein PIB30_051925 [Stylosanthes scabra]|uniref:Ubiquitin-like protease family profile domain-containing protein n=1 Tax=Stylosanthes scabra TaxID=79078 RepID=A0ABU6SI59_9FABA|nr:hypothetical protein [Stylosanthes scabra]